MSDDVGAERVLTRRGFLGAAVIGVAGACGDARAKAASLTTTTSTPTATVPTTRLDGTGSSGPATTVASSAADYWPSVASSDSVDAKAAGWSPAGLDALVATVAAANSTTFMMLANGRILVEKYFGGTTAETRQDVASCQKSVVSTLLGLARSKKLLGFDDPVSKYLPPGWSRASAVDEAKITLYHLMTHSSGLDSRTLKKVAEPGTKYDYNTDAYQKLLLVLEAAAKSDMDTISRTWLFEAIGLGAGAHWRERLGANRDATGALPRGLVLTAREMCRFGLFASRGGRWNDRQITDPGWFVEAWTPSKTKRDYGLLWWLQGRGALSSVKGVPADWVAALGAQDQKIYVVPSNALVVTRQGTAAKEASDAESDFDRVIARQIVGAHL
jgi:CubicO group peptidase (beta-lactamase class C family)